MCRRLIGRLLASDSEQFSSHVYSLMIHSASSADVLSKYPQLTGRTVSCVIPPQENKFNILVKNVSNVLECIAYVSKTLGQRLVEGASDFRFLSTTGDSLVMTRTAEDAMLTQSQLASVLGHYSDRVAVRLVGPLQMGILHDTCKRRFSPGMVYSQSLESYSSDESKQYGLKRVDMQRCPGVQS